MKKPDVLRAIEKSIKHWIGNCELAEKGKLRSEHIQSSSCALCGEYGVLCDQCPLVIWYAGCGDGPWHWVEDAIYRGKSAYAESIDMLMCLMFLREIVKTDSKAKGKS